MSRRPDYRLTLQGQTLHPELRARLGRLRLTDRRGMEADQLDLTLSDHDGRLALPPRGAELTLAIGWHGEGLVERGTYIVDEVEHSGSPDQVSIRARSADMRGDLPGKRSRSWDDLTLEQIIETIAGQHELEPVIGQSYLGALVEHIDQTEESDLHFLTRLAERFDAVATVKARRLLFVAAGQALTASGLEIPTLTLTRRDGDQHRYTSTDRDSYSGVIAQWHDPTDARVHDVIAGTDENPKRLRPSYASQADALAAATSEWQRIQRGHAEFTLQLAEGDPRLMPETPVRLRGWKAEIDATPWIVTEVTHELGDGGFTSSVQLEVRNQEGGATRNLEEDEG
ncbi:contractile injection system protein, VgrG/Pvc8 family [Billgrantia aerodenitrificans]|uniref:Phage late control D family protein n=1 Tax=Billgrantia aerodenitrificans TaxID=2733483 RepID=A0ABS9AP75_9GAMM|nr:contractile injection system protein, VgrG/Pvc8 family [Halomonas aerodenitrificans]MCE8023660.1 phage late control D family protein [Halomonas aerodenitrificans]